MALSPGELIAKLKSDSDAIGLADHAAEVEPGGDLPQSFASIPAMAILASIVASLQGTPLPPLQAAPEGEAGPAPSPPLLPSASEAPGTHQAQASGPSLSASHRTDPDAHNQLFRQKVYAAGLGLIVGLVLVAAGLLWLAGSVGPSQRSEVHQIIPIGQNPANPEEGAATWSAAKPELAPREDAIRPSEANGISDRPVAATERRSSPEPLVQEARQRIERGDVAGARELLAKGDTDPSGVVLFTLAETYDPIMLAAWGMRGVSANIDKAKGFYATALSLGYAPARRRLDALQ
jgi:hypothetical protein